MRQVLLFIVMSLSLASPAQNIYHSVNIDLQTFSAMVSAYGLETATELYYKEQINKILSHYTPAEVAAATIFLSKGLDRKALTDLGIWVSPSENHYYKRIYQLVAARILPKILTVAQIMIRRPQNALYWGSYLFKICAEIEMLCMQFETIVTNSRLSFRDIRFLKMSPQFEQLFSLSRLGGNDFKRVLDNFADVPFNGDRDQLAADIETLYNLGAQLVTMGGDAGSILGNASFDASIAEKLPTLINLATNIYRLYQTQERSMMTSLHTLLAGQSGPAAMFNISNCNTSQWLTDYNREEVGQYYTQPWYIKQGDEVVYEELFDSYSMDLATFQMQLNARMSAMEGTGYRIEGGAKKYYIATDAERIKGVESVVISLTCHDGFTLMQGSTQYKCNSCSGSLTSHTKECAMQTTASGDEMDIASFDGLISDLNTRISNILNRITSLEMENVNIRRQMLQAAAATATQLRLKLAANQEEISRLNDEVAKLREQLAAADAARNEALADMANDTDAFYRIPAIMQDCQTTFGLRWKGVGTWDGYTFTREATRQGLDGTIMFKAKLSIAREPQYFLGIKIHRAIVQIEWELTSGQSSTNIVEVIELDPTMEDAEKARMVNERVSEIARENPECEVSTQHVSSVPPETEESADVYHLLWSSDRLEIARQIEARLSHIYADLISYEKMMNYKLSIVDVLRRVAPHVDDQYGRRLSIIEEAFKRWKENARLNDK